MSTDGEKRPYFSRLVNAQGSRRLGPKYRLSKRVYSARAGQPLTAAYLFAPNSYRIAKLVRNAGFCNGLCAVNPSPANPAAGVLLLSAVGARPLPDRVG